MTMAASFTESAIPPTAFTGRTSWHRSFVPQDISNALSANPEWESHEPPRRDTGEDDDAKHESIDHEGPCRELLKDPH